MCADVVESLNAILKQAYNDHTARGGGMPGAAALQREGKVVLQVWEWWCLKFACVHVFVCVNFPAVSN